MSFKLFNLFQNFIYHRRDSFYVDNEFRNFHQIIMFWDPMSQKKRFLRKCMSVICPASVDTITPDSIIGLDCNLKNFRDKIVHLEKIYIFTSEHFLVGHVIFVLIVKNVIKN